MGLSGTAVSSPQKSSMDALHIQYSWQHTISCTTYLIFPDFYLQPVQPPTCLTPASNGGCEVPVSMHPFEEFQIVGQCILTLVPAEVDWFYPEDRLQFMLFIQYSPAI